MSTILVVDNYDSFVYTIVGYLQQLGVDTDVVRNDEVDPQRVTDYAGVVVSPGPGTPEEAGRSIDVIAACGRSGVPMLGVCLGHQALGVYAGANVGRASELLHGKTSEVFHDGGGVLAGLPSPFVATRYHSLTVDSDTVTDRLVVDGRTASGLVMAMHHASEPLFGVQFHPESVLTQHGHRLLATWLEVCGVAGAGERAVGLGPLVGS